MSVERSASRSRTPLRKSVYPLKMETIPIATNFKDSQALTQETEINSDTNLDDNVKHRMPSYESDDDFQFKRHKNKNLTGVPSLGERLDNFQDIQKAKWMDNFNSSMPNVSENFENSGKDINAKPLNIEPQQLHQQSQQSQQPHPGYMPYMYYYSMPTPGLPMMQFQNSPMAPSQVDPSQFVNKSISMMPNSSLQPFFPNQSPKDAVYSQHDIPHLLPPPMLYPYNYMHPSQTQYIQKVKERRKSLAAQRGRRVSMLSTQDDQFGIVSPHKDVPEEDFYRHIGNTSFGKSLQTRQLFNWCSIRTLRKIENEDARKRENNVVAQDQQLYTDPKSIALSIMKEFVSDLRKGNLDIDWEAEEFAYDEDESNDEADFADDTELRQLFEEDEDDTDYVPSITKRKEKRSKFMGDTERVKIPNVKNLENEKNLIILQANIIKLKDEVEGWSPVLDIQKPQMEWKDLQSSSIFDIVADQTAIDESSLDHIKDALVQSMDKLQLHSHLLHSSSKVLSQITAKKLDDLSKNFGTKVQNQLDSKVLLRELSKSLAES